MGYELCIARRAEGDLERIFGYICRELGNPAAAANFADAVDAVYAKLEENPRLYAECVQPILRAAGYRRAVIGRYLLVYRIDEECRVVYIARFFSELEDYADKL